MKRLDLSLVFKITSVEDLGNLYKALDQTMTLQEKVTLKNEIRQLNKRKEVLSSELKEIKDEIRELRPEKALSDEAEAEKMTEPMADDNGEESDAQELERADISAFIEGHPEESIQEREAEDNVQSN